MSDTSVSHVCETLRGCWRAAGEPPDLAAATLAEMSPIVVSTGSGPLVWRRIRSLPDLAGSESGEALRETYRNSQLFAEIQSVAIERIMAIVEPAGLTPLAFKGRFVARYYSDPGARPSGDIDLCAPPGRYREIADLLARHSVRPAGFTVGEASTGLTLVGDLPPQVTRIDLQRDLERFSLTPLADVFARAERVRVGDTHILVPCMEDHLRLLCLHLLEHGGWRPIWLCDVGAMLEAIGSDFDWELCLGEDRIVRQRILTVIALAHVLLDAGLDRVPEHLRSKRLPRWLVPAILEQWGRPFSAFMPRPLFSLVLRRWPEKIASEIGARWPDPIRATFELGREFDDRPRWPLQATFFVRSIMSLLARSART